MLAWIRYILEHKFYDSEFVMKWTNLPYLVDVETKMLLRPKTSTNPNQPDTFMVWDKKTNSPQPLEYPWNDALAPALEGTFQVDGRTCKTGFQLLWERCEPYTLEKAGKLCWLDPAKIEEAIRIYAENAPSGLALGVATDQTPNSVQAAMAAATLDLLMGNVERPGALLQRFRTSGCFDMPNYPVPIAADRLPPEQLKKRLGYQDHKGLGIWYAGHPSSILNAILTGEPYQPRVWIDRSGNKLGATADSQLWETAIHKLDFIVHVYMYPTSFSAYADILLPSEEWLETDMLVETCNTLVARQQVTHLWETMDETLFWSKLAKKCGELGHEACKKAFDPEYMGHDLAYWDSMEEFLDHWVNRLGMTWKEFAAKAPIEYLPRDQWRSYGVYLQPDPKNGGKPAGFPTPSKKCEVYLESMITLSRTGKPFSPIELEPATVDYDPLPYFLEPAESPLPGSEVAKEYPLVLTGGRVPFYHHNTLRNIPWLREMYPAPELWIHPKTAEIYGIAQGDWVWVESKRGKTQAVAKITQGINPGTVYMERFWNPETLNTSTHGWREMNVNMLTKASAPFNDVVGTYTLRAFQVKVTRADAPPEGVWLDPEDFKPWLPIPTKPTQEVQV